MKNYIYKISLLTISILLFVGCSEDFLNEPKPTSSVTDAVIFDSREGAESHLSGIHRMIRYQFEDDLHDVGGMHSMYFARTVKGNDFIQDSWFNFDYENDNREPTYRRTKFTWDFPYFIINQANTLINGLETSELSDLDKSQLSAQARALRAFFYFQLAMEFQHTYSYDSSLPAPPIYTELSLEGKPMSTLEEMYNLITSDLTYAVANLDNERLGKSYINNQVANGILARVYQVMGNWSGAETAAKLAYGGDVASVLDAPSYGDGFDDISNIEWLWGMPQSTDQSIYYAVAPHAFTDHYNDGYYGTYVNEDFAALFSPTDVRNLFDNTYEGEVGDYWHLTTTKFTFAFESDMLLMRYAEMILIEAEAKYWQTDEIGARNLLFQLQSNRDATALLSTNSGPDLLGEILLERRKELYGEIGVEWFDAKRLRRAIPRTGNHRLIESDLTADDKHFFLKIPEKEILANDNITDAVNANR